MPRIKTGGPRGTIALEKARWRKDNLPEIRKIRNEKTKLASEALRRMASL